MPGKRRLQSDGRLWKQHTLMRHELSEHLYQLRLRQNPFPDLASRLLMESHLHVGRSILQVLAFAGCNSTCLSSICIARKEHPSSVDDSANMEFQACLQLIAPSPSNPLPPVPHSFYESFLQSLSDDINSFIAKQNAGSKSSLNPDDRSRHDEGYTRGRQ